MALPEGVTMIEDITPEPSRMTSTESKFHTERQPPRHIRGIRAKTRPEFYQQSGMLGNGTVSGQGVFEGYVPGSTMGAHGNAQFEGAYAGSHQYPGSMMQMNQSSAGVGYMPLPEGDYGSYTENVMADSPDGIPSGLTERYDSSINCVSVAEHASNCPVCSQLYSQDNTVMYVIIAVLVLIIVLMFVKLMDCR